MMPMADTGELGQRGIDRREMLRRIAMTGAVAMAPPILLSATAGTASAGGPDDPDCDNDPGSETPECPPDDDDENGGPIGALLRALLRLFGH
jgi:hypothetical protein